MWRSSVAIFAYEPDLSDLPEVALDREITFLKVSCSLTAFHACDLKRPVKPDETIYLASVAKLREHVRHNRPDLLEGLGRDAETVLREYAERAPVVKKLLADIAEYQAEKAQYDAMLAEVIKLENASFPCSGALLQVSIYPKQDQEPPSDPTQLAEQLAYFTAFEPQKRELIEVVTESGESITQSKSQVNVRKGVTSTDSTEDLDVFAGANIKAGFGGAEVGVGIQGQWGTIKKATSERVDVTNTDASREAREGASHTTHLSQLYHVLNSYHLGTNRALFFIQPRPHTVQQKDRFTFITGPQEIEGVQEFMLVASRPKGTKLEDFCVDALLYTAHLEPDATRAALMEPKTYETPWFELWGAAQNPKRSSDDFFSGLAKIAAGIFSGDPGAAVELTNEFIAHRYEEINNVLFNRPENEPIDAVKPLIPIVIDQTFSHKPGWRIDRSRGLGGYDLWEDPDNFSWNVLGKPSDSGTKPQAFIDIFSTGSPDDPANYHPDSHLRVQAFVFPLRSGDDDDTSLPTRPNPDLASAFYHARIKVYFVRDDLPDPDRTLPMFVTIRGVSTCAESPYSNLYRELTKKGITSIVAERQIAPPNVAPYATPALTPKTPPIPAKQGDLAPSPETRPQLNSDVPPVDAGTIGASRAKMANGISDEIRAHLRSSFGCGNPVIHFKEVISFDMTDIYTRRVIAAGLRTEVKRLFSRRENVELAHHVALNPHARSFGAPSARIPETATALRSLFAGMPAPDRRFPLLTLANVAITDEERAQLASAGITSGLDLVKHPASAIATRAGLSLETITSLRSKVAGLGTAPSPVQQG